MHLNIDFEKLLGVMGFALSILFLLALMAK